MTFQTYETKLKKLQLIESLLDQLDICSEFSDLIETGSDLDRIREKFVVALTEEHEDETRAARKILHTLKIV